MYHRITFDLENLKYFLLIILYSPGGRFHSRILLKSSID